MKLKKNSGTCRLYPFWDGPLFFEEDAIGQFYNKNESHKEKHQASAFSKNSGTSYCQPKKLMYNFSLKARKKIMPQKIVEP